MPVVTIHLFKKSSLGSSVAFKSVKAKMKMFEDILSSKPKSSQSDCFTSSGNLTRSRLKGKPCFTYCPVNNNMVTFVPKCSRGKTLPCVSGNSWFLIGFLCNGI